MAPTAAAAATAATAQLTVQQSSSFKEAPSFSFLFFFFSFSFSCSSSFFFFLPLLNSYPDGGGVLRIGPVYCIYEGETINNTPYIRDVVEYIYIYKCRRLSLNALHYGYILLATLVCGGEGLDSFLFPTIYISC